MCAYVARLVRVVVVVVVTLVVSWPMAARGQGMSMREASGTAWQPDASPMYAVQGRLGAWQVMTHWNVFAAKIHERGPRGGTQADSLNWVMGGAGRTAGSGHVGLTAMLSAEPWTVPACGYPNALATGELCGGEGIHDRQHPHDVFMALTAEYDRPLAGSVRWQVYGGPVGEPALGPPAFSHRVSALPNPMAPISHHWFDSTHVSFGVLTGGVYGRRWKAESSVFNGREPDDRRTDINLGSLTSYSGRVWLMPTSHLALQVSAGQLREAEAGHGGGPRVDVARVTASASYTRVFRGASFWAATAGWGRNNERGAGASNAVLAEANLTVAGRDAWFGRWEAMGKSGHDLDVPSSEVFSLSKAQGGYTRYLGAWHHMVAGVGGTVSAARVPATLVSYYGRRTNLGLGIFVTLRPPGHVM